MNPMPFSALKSAINPSLDLEFLKTPNISGGGGGGGVNIESNYTVEDPNFFHTSSHILFMGRVKVFSKSF